jgi:hypothetical protein
MFARRTPARPVAASSAATGPLPLPFGQSLRGGRVRGPTGG